MPWFLKAFIKYHIVAVATFLLGILCIYFGSYISGVVLLFGFIYIYFALFTYRQVLKKYKKQSEVFSPSSLVRNVDYLVIGDMYSVEEKGSYVQISSPDRGIEAIFEILKHTHSILKEGGCVILALREKNIEKSGFSIFDIPFFHHITVERLKKENRTLRGGVKSVLAHPLMYLGYVLDVKKRYFEQEIENEPIEKFCSERGYELIYKIR